MSSVTNLTGEEYWEKIHGKPDYKIAAKNHPVRQWFEQFISPREQSCMEIGCFPGQFLACFGELGYQLNGIDWVAEVNTSLPAWLKKQGYKTGDFFKADFLSFSIGKTFDIVSSFGFIEHFINWEEVFKRQLDLVSPKGFLLMSTPNFAGKFQRIFQAVFNRKSYKRHNIRAIDPKAWEKIVNKEGFEVVFCGYYGKIHYWADEQKRNFLAKLALHFLIRIVLPVLKFLPLPKNKKLYSPICGIIARRIKTY